nr:hypothetical protein Itr_chr02CG17160 [Ipomoea trifida]
MLTISSLSTSISSPVFIFRGKWWEIGRILSNKRRHNPRVCSKSIRYQNSFIISFTYFIVLSKSFHESLSDVGEPGFFGSAPLVLVFFVSEASLKLEPGSLDPVRPVHLGEEDEPPNDVVHATISRSRLMQQRGQGREVHCTEKLHDGHVARGEKKRVNAVEEPLHSLTVGAMVELPRDLEIIGDAEGREANVPPTSIPSLLGNRIAERERAEQALRI